MMSELVFMAALGTPRWPSYVIHGGFQAGDLLSTEIGLRAGAHEGNPLPMMQTRGGRIAIKSAVSVGVAELDYRLMLKKQKKAAWALRILDAGLSTFAIIHNAGHR